VNRLQACASILATFGDENRRGFGVFGRAFIDSEGLIPGNDPFLYPYRV
jgi:hypothetical protein